MAELIDKKEALAQIKSIPYSTQEEILCKFVARDRIRQLPTTTEAEIIEKFVEKLGEVFSEHSSEIKVDGNKFDILTLDSAIEIMWDLVNELKEE